MLDLAQVDASEAKGRSQRCGSGEKMPGWPASTAAIVFLRTKRERALSNSKGGGVAQDAGHAVIYLAGLVTSQDESADTAR